LHQERGAAKKADEKPDERVKDGQPGDPLSAISPASGRANAIAAVAMPSVSGT